MTWQSSFFPINRLAISVFFAGLSILPIVPASAMSFGQTLIQSHQNEPLFASMAISDIDSATFDVQLADAQLYQTMGLSQNRAMTVSFSATSKTAGTVLIQTQKPINAPFADVVLAINNQGQQKIIPKTLLMPLKDSLALSTMPFAADIAPMTETVLQSQPLLVRNEVPPPLFPQSSQPTANLTNRSEIINAKSVTPIAIPLTVLPANMMPELELPIDASVKTKPLHATSANLAKEAQLIAKSDQDLLSKQLLAQAKSSALKADHHLKNLKKNSQSSTQLDVAVKKLAPNDDKLSANTMISNTVVSRDSNTAAKTQDTLTIHQNFYYQRAVKYSAITDEDTLVTAKNEISAKVN